MPIYTYRCENCSVQFEHQQRFNDANISQCPECEEEALRRVYKPVGVIFKGSGFYATDHRSPSGVRYSDAESAESGDPKKPAEKKDTHSEKNESKPAKAAKVDSSAEK